MSGEITASIAAPFKRSLRLPPDEITIKLWPARPGFHDACARRRRRRPNSSDLARPLSDNSVLRARLGVRQRRSAMIGVIVGAIAVLGIALSLASYTHDPETISPGSSQPASSVGDRSLAATPARDEPRSSTFNLVTNVDIQTTCVSPESAPGPAPIAERQSFVPRDRPRVRPAKSTAPTEKKTEKTTSPVEENPYETGKSSSVSPTQSAKPAVDENPY